MDLGDKEARKLRAKQAADELEAMEAAIMAEMEKNSKLSTGPPIEKKASASTENSPHRSKRSRVDSHKKSTGKDKSRPPSGAFHVDHSRDKGHSPSHKQQSKKPTKTASPTPQLTPVTEKPPKDYKVLFAEQKIALENATTQEERDRAKYKMNKYQIQIEAEDDLAKLEAQLEAEAIRNEIYVTTLKNEEVPLEKIQAEKEALRKAEKAAQDQILVAERIAAEKAASEKIAAEKERLEAEQRKAAAEKAAAEKAAAEKAAAEKAAAERAAAERAAAERAAAAKAAAEKAAAEKAAAEKAAAEKAAAEKAAQEKAAMLRASSEHKGLPLPPTRVLTTKSLPPTPPRKTPAATPAPTPPKPVITSSDDTDKKKEISGPISDGTPIKKDYPTLLAQAIEALKHATTEQEKERLNGKIARYETQIKSDEDVARLEAELEQEDAYVSQLKRGDTPERAEQSPPKASKEENLKNQAAKWHAEALKKAKEEEMNKRAEELRRKEEEIQKREEFLRMEALKVKQEAERLETLRKDAERIREESIRQEEIRNRQEAERKASELEQKNRELERMAKEESEKKIREEMARKTKEESEKKFREETERKAKEESERKFREEMERKAKELERKLEEERRAKEETERRLKEETERRLKEETDRKSKEDAERKLREERLEAEQRAKAESERKAQEERARTELERKKKESEQTTSTTNPIVPAWKQRLLESKRQAENEEQITSPKTTSRSLPLSPHSPVSYPRPQLSPTSSPISPRTHCQQCKTPLEPAVSFCKFCGTKVVKTQETDSKVAAAKAAFEPKPTQNVFTSPRQTALSPRPQQSIATSVAQVQNHTGAQRTFPLRDLVVKEGRPYPTGVDPLSREQYLNDSEFFETFKMSKAEFSALPAWKKLQLKKNVCLH